MEEHDYYNKYLESLKETYGKLTDDTTEMSGRFALETLLKEVANSISKPRTITHEPASIDGSAPDYKIEHTTAIIGYLENKRPDSDLNRVIKSEQIKRYQKLSNNIMLTNYHEWIWLKDDNLPQKVKLFKLDDLQNSRFRLDSEKIEKLHRILFSFLEAEPEPIADVSKFAEALAVRTRILNEFMISSLNKHSGGRLHGLYEAFKQQLHPQLKIAEFADTYAQMLTYGLFLARLNDKGDTQITLKNAEDFIPDPFELMKELVSFLGELKNKKYEEIKWVVEEILFIINTMNREAIARSLSFKYRPSRSMFKGKDKAEFEMFSTDPFIYFYEDFLAAYNPELRESRGVYYTPPPVVKFIIRSLDYILKNKFGIDEGFANTEKVIIKVEDEKTKELTDKSVGKVTVLDFACGTGTFILEIFEEIFNFLKIDTANEGKANPVIREHLLKNIYGFEFLIAAYAIAHLKLWQYLTDKNYQFQDEERLKIILSNTLESPKAVQANLFLPALSGEAKLGAEIKDRNILVITGNPPYSGHSQNPQKINGEKTDIVKLIEDYKEINGIPIKERQIKWLQDDYVKFIRFAHHKMETADEGVVGIITNHAFIDNPTFRAMRHSLMNTFDQIYIIDLHGNSKRQEKKPNGKSDNNVFDIQQGVAISFFIKKRDLPEDEKGIYHADLWGSRKEKYKWAFKTNFYDVNWRKLLPANPDYLFIPQDIELKPEYNEGCSVRDIFNINSVAALTARDHLAIQFTEEEIKKTVAEFALISSKKARQHFKLGKDSRDWKVAFAQKDIKEHGQDDKMFHPILYRPFDKRFTYYSGQSRGFFSQPCCKVMYHMLKPNLALITVRQVAEGKFNHALISENITDFRITLSNRGGGYVFPLYAYAGKKSTELGLSKNEREENFKQKFRTFIDTKYGHEFSPEEIMAYIYAILHSPTYRSRYKEFLSLNYPRIPFCENKENFEQLAKVGQELIDLHLMTANQPNINLWKGKGDNFEVEKIDYNEKTEKLYINKDKYLYPIPKEVWEFNMGGYQVLAKYLKSYKGHIFDLNKLNHVERIVDIIQNTMKAMETLDSLTKKAFRHWHK